MPAAPTALARLFSARILAEDPSALEQLRSSLVRNKGNLTHTAVELGVSLRTLHRWGDDVPGVKAIVEKHGSGIVGRPPSAKAKEPPKPPKKRGPQPKASK